MFVQPEIGVLWKPFYVTDLDSTKHKELGGKKMGIGLKKAGVIQLAKCLGAFKAPLTL